MKGQGTSNYTLKVTLHKTNISHPLEEEKCQLKRVLGRAFGCFIFCGGRGYQQRKGGTGRLNNPQICVVLIQGPAKNRCWQKDAQ